MNTNLDFLAKTSTVHKRTNTADSAPTATSNSRAIYRINQAQRARVTSQNRIKNLNIGSMVNDPLNQILFNENDFQSNNKNRDQLFLRQQLNNDKNMASTTTGALMVKSNTVYSTRQTPDMIQSATADLNHFSKLKGGRQQHRRNLRASSDLYSHTLAVPTNFELTALSNGMDPSATGATLKNFRARNISDLRTFKTSKIAKSKEQIEQIHS